MKVKQCPPHLWTHREQRLLRGRTTNVPVSIAKSYEAHDALRSSPRLNMAQGYASPVGLGPRRDPHADELGRSRCNTHWKDPAFSPKDRG